MTTSSIHPILIDRTGTLVEDQNLSPSIKNSKIERLQTKQMDPVGMKKHVEKTLRSELRQFQYFSKINVF